jgi:hypothetical protein
MTKEFQNDVNTKTKRIRNSELDEWVTKLANQQKDISIPSATKHERIEKRLAKKRRIDESKQQVRNVKHPSTLKPASAFGDTQKKSIARKPQINTSVEVVNNKRDFQMNGSSQKSSRRLNKLAEKVEERVLWIKERRRSYQKPYVASVIIPSNTSQRRRQQHAKNLENWFQPLQSNYGGIGFARPSLFIALDDPSWQPKLEEEFSEHIPGFFGKQRTKAMKKQLDGQMLWRQLQKQKVAQSSLNKKQPIKINGKKISEMTPDQRVEAMIQAGYI